MIACASETADRLWRAHGVSLRAGMKALCRDDELADDLTSETFVRLIRHLRGDPCPPVNPEAWLWVTGRRLFFDHLRLMRHRCEVLVAEMPPSTPSRPFDAIDLVETLLDITSGLPAVEREVFVLQMAQDFTYDEIGSALDVPVSTVRAARHRAVRRLREDRYVVEALSGHHRKE